jgi:hypothetical protein
MKRGNCGYCESHPTVVLALRSLKQKSSTAKELAGSLQLSEDHVRGHLLIWLERNSHAFVVGAVKGKFKNSNLWSTRRLHGNSQSTTRAIINVTTRQSDS